ncbi:MAG: hypothetical protein JO097_15810 [Acidobacteriaceae bacterium]|nr:hypothetical protein [Acidobacteriaceae bacterium]MBV9763838.1 hypothetical protein [Acidobacteriaceae bacterium]
MSADNVFRSPGEELARLNNELAEIRGILRDATTRLAQIERHVKRAFGVPESPKSAAAPRPKDLRGGEPSISPEEALEIFRELTDISRAQGSTAVEGRLERMSIPDLKLMAHELGVSFSSKPGRKNLHGGIRGRISESVMLSPSRATPAASAQSKRDAKAEAQHSSAQAEPDE